jgi:hypothetical protein
MIPTTIAPYQRRPGLGTLIFGIVLLVAGLAVTFMSDAVVKPSRGPIVRRDGRPLPWGPRHGPREIQRVHARS